ncbi:transglycosylase family protein, partial [Streptomyces somaliensis]|uniref:transglycosylase family protein n=1 Tax=Streptomyces somaliensis TaxID=78355 RepID=UPI00263BC0F3
MRSGNGRHRRPRQAPALVVAAGVTGSAIALPLLGAGTASAADAATWDRVAECETGGMWSADLGNGYYGGLQLSQEDWQAYGGTAYAPRADLATRAQQIAVAEKVLTAEGSTAWETCAPIAGLAGGSAPAGSGPGTAPEPAASTGTDAGEPREPAGRTGSTTGAGDSPAPGATEEGAGTAPDAPTASTPPAPPTAPRSSTPCT